MSNEEKYSILYYNLAFGDDSSKLGDINSFFDESFVEYLSNKKEQILWQVIKGLKTIDFSKIELSNPLSKRDRCLIVYLLNKKINISSILSNLNENQYNDIVEYLRGLQAINLLYTNDLSIINQTNFIIEDYADLFSSLNSDEIDNKIKKYILSYKENRELFINSFNVWNFYEFVYKLGLDESFVDERENKLINIILNGDIDIEDFRNIICELICKDSYNNFILNLKMIQRYYLSEKDISSELAIYVNYMMLVKKLLEDDVNEIDIDLFKVKFREIGEIYKKTIEMVKENFDRRLKEKLVNEDIYLIHSISSDEFLDIYDIRDVYYKQFNKYKESLSFNLINKDSTNISCSIDKAIIFGYNEPPNTNLLIASLGDVVASQSRIWTIGSYLSIDDYLAKSFDNKILYEKNQALFLPNYLISFHEKPTKLEEKIANEFNIPIKHLEYNVSYPDKMCFEEDYQFNYDKINYIISNLNKGKLL